MITEDIITSLRAVELFHINAAKEAARQRQKLEGSGISSSSRKGKSNIAIQAGMEHFKKVIARKSKRA